MLATVSLIILVKVSDVSISIYHFERISDISHWPAFAGTYFRLTFPIWFSSRRSAGCVSPLATPPVAGRQSLARARFACSSRSECLNTTRHQTFQRATFIVPKTLCVLLCVQCWCGWCSDNEGRLVVLAAAAGSGGGSARHKALIRSVARTNFF